MKQFACLTHSVT